MGRWRASRRAVLLVLLVSVPVVFDTSVVPVFTLPKYTVLVVGAFVLMVLVAAGLAQKDRFGWRKRLVVPVLVFLGWTALSATVSPDPRQSLFGARDSLNGLVTVAALVVVFFTVADGFDRARARTALAVLWFASGGAVLLYGAIQLVGHGRWDPIPWVNRPSRGVIWSTLGNPNDLAGFVAMLLPPGLVLLATARSAVARWGAALLVGVSLVELVVTSSRGGLLGAAAGIVFLAGWAGRRVLRSRRVLMIAGSLVLAAVVGAAGVALAVGDEGTIALRVELWRGALHIAGEEPVFGVGPDRFGPAFDAVKSERFVRRYGRDVLATDAHNVLLTVVATTGIPGLAAFGAVVIGALVGLRRRGADLLGAGVGAAIVAYLVQASFNRQDIALDFCFWFLLGLSCVLSSSPAGAGEGGESDDHGHASEGERDPGDGPVIVPAV